MISKLACRKTGLKKVYGMYANNLIILTKDCNLCKKKKNSRNKSVLQIYVLTLLELQRLLKDNEKYSRAILKCKYTYTAKVAATKEKSKREWKDITKFSLP